MFDKLRAFADRIEHAGVSELAGIKQDFHSEVSRLRSYVLTLETKVHADAAYISALEARAAAAESVLTAQADAKALVSVAADQVTQV